MSTPDPYLKQQTTLRNRLGRAVWGVAWVLLFRPTPRPLHAWRAFILRCFGAKLGSDCHIYPKAKIWAPWNLKCGNVVAIADEAEIYNPWPITLGSKSTISQQAFLCSATHDIDDSAFPMVGAPISVHNNAWVCARATVLAGVTVHAGAVLGLASVATRDLEAWSLYAGVPARFIRKRKNNA